MYFVDSEKIEETLVYMENILKVFAGQKEWKSPIEKLALERIVHTAIESILDVGNAMIDGFIMRDPGSYEDIIDILEDENVITEDEASDLRDVIRIRKMLVQQYVRVDDEEVARVFSNSLKSLESFPASVRQYLTNELGPVSAFLPKK